MMAKMQIASQLPNESDDKKCVCRLQNISQIIRPMGLRYASKENLQESMSTG